jgi:hypothetical protein
MTVKEIRNYLFSGANIKLVYENKPVFLGYANELPDCPYSEYEVRSEGIHTMLNDNIIRIIIINSQEE